MPTTLPENQPSAGIGVVQVQKLVFCLRFCFGPRDPLRGSARSRYKSSRFCAILLWPAQPFARIGAVEVQKLEVFAILFWPATLCGGRRGRGAKTFCAIFFGTRDPLRGSARSRCKNSRPARPSAGIGVVEGCSSGVVSWFARLLLGPAGRGFDSPLARGRASQAARSNLHKAICAEQVAQTSLRRATCAEQLAQTSLCRAPCLEQLAQSNLRRATCTAACAEQLAGRLARSNLHRATCREPLAGTNLHKATCAEQLAHSNLHRATCAEQLAQTNLHRPVCAEHLAQSNLRRATCTYCNLHRATCAKQLAQSNLRVCQAGAKQVCRRLVLDLARDVLLSGQPWSSFKGLKPMEDE